MTSKEALASQPPKEEGSFRAAELVDLTTMDPILNLVFENLGATAWAEQDHADPWRYSAAR